MTAQELTNAFTNAGLDTEQKVSDFLRPSAIAAVLADYDGKIASFRDETGSLATERQATLAQLEAEREAVRLKLQNAK